MRCKDLPYLQAKFDTNKKAEQSIVVGSLGFHSFQGKVNLLPPWFCRTELVLLPQSPN